MPGTGIKNREGYLNRVLNEEATAVKGSSYAAYLQALRTLVEVTNQIYTENDGQLTPDTHQQLTNAYLAVARAGSEYKDSSRRNVVDHIHKIISRDLKVLNGMDKEKPGTLDAAFEESRSAKVVVPQELTSHIGGQTSQRFPIKAADGTKGFFTARADTAQNEKWAQVVDRIKTQYGFTSAQGKKIDRLKTNPKLRQKILEAYHYPEEGKDIVIDGALALGLVGSRNEAKQIKNTNPTLKAAMEDLGKSTVGLTTAMNLADRLGYDPYTRTDNKNAAMYDVARLLGCERIIAKAVPMVVVSGDKVYKGTFMENAEGSDLARLKPDDPLWEYQGEFAKEWPFKKSLYQDLADIQLLDYICGNVDRHYGNMLYKMDTTEPDSPKIAGITGIDNDASFPDTDLDDFEFSHEQSRIFRPENFRFVTKKTAEIVKGLTREQLVTLLRGHNLTPAAIDKAWKRTQDVQNVLNNMEKHGITYADDLDENKYGHYNEKNPFSADSKFKKNPSIFYNFTAKMQDEVDHEKTVAKEDQEKRVKEGKSTVSRRYEHSLEIDPEEYGRYLEERDKGYVPRDGVEADRKQALLADCSRIERMDTLMKRANRLKAASSEFAAMRDAMYQTAAQAKDLSERIRRGEEITDADYQQYEQNLTDLDKATKNYIQEKGLTPRTEKGKDRLDAAMRIENRVEDLLVSFNFSKNMSEQQKEENVNENEGSEL